MSKCPDWEIGRTAKGFSKEEKLRIRLLLKKSRGRGATGIVKGFGKEEKAAYQALVLILVGEHSQVLEAIPHCDRAHLKFLGQDFDCFIVIQIQILSPDFLLD